jgi:hypothetical protein
VTTCTPDSGEVLSPTVIGAIIAFVATLAGVGITEWSTRFREGRAQKLDWNRRLFDKYADAYRDFLATWDGSPNAAVLKAAFDSLRSKALVPDSIMRQYQTTLALVESSADVKEREASARELRTNIENMLNDPTGLVSG